MKGKATTRDAKNKTSGLEPVLQVLPRWCFGEIGGEVRTQGRDEPLIRPYRRSRLAMAANFIGNQISHQLAYCYIAFTRNNGGLAAHFLMQFQGD